MKPTYEEVVQCLENLVDAIAKIDTTQNRSALINNLGTAEEAADEILKRVKEGA